MNYCIGIHPADSIQYGHFGGIYVSYGGYYRNCNPNCILMQRNGRWEIIISIADIDCLWYNNTITGEYTPSVGPTEPCYVGEQLKDIVAVGTNFYVTLLHTKYSYYVDTWNPLFISVSQQYRLHVSSNWIFNNIFDVLRWEKLAGDYLGVYNPVPPATDIITIYDIDSAPSPEPEPEPEPEEEELELGENDSYAIVEEANEYFLRTLNSDAWNHATDNNKKRALIMSTRAINHLNFAGYKTNPDQILEFPRNNDSEIPEAIKEATCENAIELLNGKSIEDEIERQKVSYEAVADVKVAYNAGHSQEYIMAGIVSAKAWMLLKPYLRDAGSVRVQRK